MLINQVVFPVYKLGNTAPVMHDGISFYVFLKDHDDAQQEETYLIIDDKNIDESSLARRRLKLQTQGVKLYNLKFAIFFIQDLIKLTKGATWYIDSTGKIFEYKKSRVVPLIFRKIKNIIPIKTGGAIVEVEGIMSRFKMLHLPKLEYKYAGLLKVDNGYILYGVYNRQLNDTKRMI